MKRIVLVLAWLLAALSFADQSVYSDQLDNGWNNWSWASTNPSCTAPVHSGKYSISVSETGTNQALYLENATQLTTSLHSIVFWINGGTTGGQLLQVQATLNGTASVAYSLPPLKANSWQQIIVPLSALGAGSVNNFDGFWIQDRSGLTEGTWYVDDVSITQVPLSTPNQQIYGEALANAWFNSSTAAVSLSNTSAVHSGKHSISVTESQTYQSLYLRHSSQDATLYRTISFWINGGSKGGQVLQVYATSSGTAQTAYSLPPLTKNEWFEVVIPLQALGIDLRGDFDGLMISDQTGTIQSTYYVDDVNLNVSPFINRLATISITATSPKAISPLIYGVNSTDFAGLGPGFTMARQGGNRLTAYNWTNNASNAGSDWYYENDDLMGTTDVAGWTGLTFVQACQAGGALPLLTIPMVDYVAADKLGGNQDIRTSPNYLTTRLRQNLPVKPGGNYVYPPDTSIYQVYEDEFVSYISQYATPGFPLMFDLDNEPDLWSSTHPEVHPDPVTYAEMVSRTTAYGTQIKSIYPSAILFGPVSYGWAGYRTLQSATDANGRDFLTFFLQSMAAADKKAGKRLLDVLDLHWYPEATGDGTRIVDEGDSAGLAAARIQASRSLWDPTYVETSWITQYSTGGAGINLIPSTVSLITGNYPGTKLSFSEYNYGGGNSISGAIAQADVLGVFGRFGVYAASNWGLGTSEASELAGFQSFINYDRAGSKFGDLALSVSGETAAQNSVYAALDSKNSKRMTLVVINKTSGSTPFNIDISKFVVTSAKAYAVTSGNYAIPVPMGVLHFSDGIYYTAPPLSVTTIELLSK